MRGRVLGRLPWIAALILVAGAATLAVVLLGGGDDEPTSTRAAAVGADDEAAVAAADVQSPGTRKKVPLAPAVRRTAGEFILSTVTRDDLGKGWTLVHPELKAECGCTRAEWLTGNIPIQPYPGEALEDASFAIEESYADEAMLEVALLPKKGSAVQPEIFWIGLKAVGDGAARKWLVYYWAPRVTIPVPVANE